MRCPACGHMRCHRRSKFCTNAPSDRSDGCLSPVRAISMRRATQTSWCFIRWSSSAHSTARDGLPMRRHAFRPTSCADLGAPLPIEHVETIANELDTIATPCPSERRIFRHCGRANTAPSGAAGRRRPAKTAIRRHRNRNRKGSRLPRTSKPARVEAGPIAAIPAMRPVSDEFLQRSDGLADLFELLRFRQVMRPQPAPAMAATSNPASRIACAAGGFRSIASAQAKIVIGTLRSRKSHHPPESDPAAVLEHAFGGEVAPFDRLVDPVRLGHVGVGYLVSVENGASEPSS